MSRRLKAWLDGRRPHAPEGLHARIEDAAEREEKDAAGDGVEPIVGELLQAGMSSLSRARSRPGRVRETAFELLVADALLTYACEAALESESAEEILNSILTLGASA